MNVWHRVSKERITPKKFLACIEIPKGSKNKYEFDKETGTLRLDRILYTSTHYPQNYGFVPRTFADDNDPLDVLVLCSESIVPLALVECYPIGCLEMIDGGQRDEKIIAICSHDPLFNCFRSIDELPPHISTEIAHFFTVYKELEGKKTIVNDIRDAAYAEAVIQRAIDAYQEKFGDNYLYKKYGLGD